MFTTVAKNFFKFLAAYFCLLVAFALRKALTLNFLHTKSKDRKKLIKFCQSYAKMSNAPSVFACYFQTTKASMFKQCLRLSKLWS